MLRILLVLLFAGPLLALEPSEIIIIANKDMPDSVSLAKYYAAKRDVPQENIFLTSLPLGEDIQRIDFDKKLVEPLRDEIEAKKTR